MPAPRPVWDRTIEKIDASGDCWVWTGSRGSHGYGQVSIGNRPALAHRVVWGLLVGPIPNGMQVDHLCRVRHCVNPDHLQIVTQAENIRRGASKAMIASLSRRCKRGHSLAAMPATWNATDRKSWCPTCSRWYRAARTFAKWAAA